MVTQASKLREAERAIRCFGRQTFPERELVIVHDGGSDFETDLQQFAYRYSDVDIRIVSVDPGLALGELRNLSVEAASYPVICQWDDDDLYHPERLAIQYSMLTECDSDFCFLTDQLHWFEQEGWFFWDDWNVETYPMNLIQGTIMGRKDRLGRYPDLPRGEDTPVIVDIARRKLKVATLERRGYLYIYTYNGKNAWDAGHHEAISAWKRMRRGRLERHLPELTRYLSGYEFDFDVVKMPHDNGTVEIRL